MQVHEHSRWQCTYTTQLRACMASVRCASINHSQETPHCAAERATTNVSAAAWPAPNTRSFPLPLLDLDLAALSNGSSPAKACRACLQPLWRAGNVAAACWWRAAVDIGNGSSGVRNCTRGGVRVLWGSRKLYSLSGFGFIIAGGVVTARTF
jgi:hypothetical protein